jgi:hypothetical protein
MFSTVGTLVVVVGEADTGVCVRGFLVIVVGQPVGELVLIVGTFAFVVGQPVENFVVVVGTLVVVVGQVV